MRSVVFNTEGTEIREKSRGSGVIRGERRVARVEDETWKAEELEVSGWDAG